MLRTPVLTVLPLAGGLFAAWLGGAGLERAACAAEPPRDAANHRPNLVLITLDTTRADHLGSAGWAHARTPHLDALAGRGVRFERCDTAAPITLPSHATLLTGLLPPRHGVRDNGTFVLKSDATTLAEQLVSAGYDTGAVVSAVVLARRHGLDQGFRIYDDDLGPGTSAGTVVEERPAGSATTAALAALAELRPPYFLWVHYYDPHEEYRPPSRFADQASGPHRLYDGEIAYMDSEIGKLLAALPPTTVVAVIGDHGEMLGEHGEATHGLLPFAGARRVPFLIAGPGVPAGRVSPCLVRTADLAPTLVELAGLPVPPGLDGESLASGLDAAATPAEGVASCGRVAYSESFLPYYAYKWYPLRTLSDGRALFLQAPTPSLFRLDLDPNEEHDVAATEPELTALWAARLERSLSAAGESLAQATSPQSSLDEEQRRQLASLGYLSGAGAAGGEVAANLPDPRSRTGIAQALHTAVERIQRGECTDVLRELERIVREDPHNFPALALAGQCLRDAGRHADALALYRRAAAENPASAVPVANIAGALLALGRRAEAETEFRHALALDPSEGDSAANLARLLEGGGKTSEAMAVLDRAVTAGATSAQLFLERGRQRAGAGRLDEALADFREAVRRSPGDPQALEQTARAQFQLGRLREAAATYEALGQLVPQRSDVWKTLVALYLEVDLPAEVERCARAALRVESDPLDRARLEELLAGLGAAQ